MSTRPQFPPAAGPLSEGAVRLLSALRQRGARSPLTAITDKELAKATHLRERDLIDYARELLEAGYLVLARCGQPWGRYLLEAGDDLKPAYDYRESLRKRGRATMHRAKLLEIAIRKTESVTPQQTGGQLAFDLPMRNAADWSKR